MQVSLQIHCTSSHYDRPLVESVAALIYEKIAEKRTQKKPEKKIFGSMSAAMPLRWKMIVGTDTEQVERWPSLPAKNYSKYRSFGHSPSVWG